MQIDFDGLRQRIISVPGVPERQYSELQSGSDGSVYYLELPARGQGGGGFGAGAGNELIRYRLCDRRASVHSISSGGTKDQNNLGVSTAIEQPLEILKRRCR